MSGAGAGQNLVLPFQVDRLDIRGRVVHLGAVLDTILARHDYPDAVSSALAELILIAILLGNSVKFDGTFTVQTKSDGAIPMVVADFVTAGAVRGYARFDGDKLAALGPGPHPVATLFGTGYLALTIDQGPDIERYQGIVALEGDTLADCAETYFRNSEQIPTLVRLAARRAPFGGPWRAGGLMVQHLPGGGLGPRLTDGHLPDAVDDDHWTTARLKAETVTTDELTGATVGPDVLLWRLFHEDGVRVYPAVTLAAGCRCSRDHIARVLGQFPPEDRADMAVDGRIVVTCEFCNAGFAFDPERLAP